MSNITIYCGSSANLAPEFIEAARALGRRIAAAGATLVYGAGRTGLMGAAADAALAAGGKVTGIIPGFMVERGWHHRGLTDLVVTDTMHTRKEKMAATATGIIARPGGIGTFEELTEAITWRQLGLLNANIVILNTAGYYDAFLSMLHNAVDHGFMNTDHLRLFSVASTAAEAVEMALAPVEHREFSAKF